MQETLSRKEEIEQLTEWIIRRERRIMAASKEAGMVAGMERMLVEALRLSVPFEAIESMCKNAGITNARFAELKLQA